MEQVELEVLHPLAVVGFIFDLLGEVELAEQAGHTKGKNVRWKPGGEKIPLIPPGRRQRFNRRRRLEARLPFARQNLTYPTSRFCRLAV
jgi:hypothetical protein